MKARLFCYEKDYKTVSKWWKDWGQEPINPFLLPRTGLIVSNGDKDICCAWLYRTDSAFCIVDWIISDKFSDKHLRKGCVEYLFEELFKIAKEIGFLTVFTTTNNQFLSKKLEKLDYKLDNNNMKSYFKQLR